MIEYELTTMQIVIVAVIIGVVVSIVGIFIVQTMLALVEHEWKVAKELEKRAQVGATP